MAQITEEALGRCGKEIADLERKIQAARAKMGPNGGHDDLPTCKAASDAHSLGAHRIRHRRTLTGHFGKIYSMMWCPAEERKYNVISASQDGRLIMWNAMSTHKLKIITLQSAWVMTVAFCPSGTMAASGGLDNLATVYKFSDETKESKIVARLMQHEGYVACCRFLTDGEMLTASGDSSCILWDVETQKARYTFAEHQADVMSVAPWDQRIFITGSCDTLCKVWDLRAKRCVQTHEGHESDINSVCVFPDGNAFGSGSDDSSCRLYDIRCWNEVNTFSDESILCGITSIQFSGSGRMLFAGYDDFNCHIWDVIKGRIIPPPLAAHTNRVSCLGLDVEGSAICTGSWDCNLRVWA